MDSKLAPGYILWFVAMVATFYVAVKTNNITLNLMLVICGGVLGWVAGLLISPKQDEGFQFSEYLKGISTLVTGGVFVKIECILSHPSESMHLNDPVLLTRILLFATAFFLDVLFVYIGRKYI